MYFRRGLMTPEERFERIERNLEHVTDRLDGITDRLDDITDRLDRITEAHIELEAAQKNTTLVLERFIEETRVRGKEVDERIANLTILVDRLVERDLGRSNGNI
jgi:archaellum component FlaC